ncbi:hypothetical protein U9M48_023335 [Paspalum notatum var. saurae]|uniref:Uncharacterized protein n=1 Tax=Paspalum notatum var. saurae TaxID=547442 RepID=A0AAQ3TN39_PASNO
MAALMYCIVALMVAAASVPSASASDTPAMIPFNPDSLIPASSAEALTKGRAGGVAIQRELLGDTTPAMIPFNPDSLIPASSAEAMTKGRAGGVAIQRVLADDDVFLPVGSDEARSGVGGIRSAST